MLPVVRLSQMPIQRPKPNRAYWFVRPNDGRPDWLVFQCYDDGSATTATLESETIWENEDDVWRQAWDSVAADGFVLLSDAIAAGAVSADAVPPHELSFYGTPTAGGDV